jgi:intracellular septation protein
MMDAPAKPASPARPTAGQGARLLVDVGPVAVFMVVYNVLTRSRPEDAIFIAAGVYIAATLAALLYALTKQKRFPWLLVVTAALVTLFGGATIVLRDAIYLYIKPTVINLLYAVGIIGSLAVRQNIVKLLLGSAIQLPDRVWRNLAIRFALWFVFLAALNEVVWRNFSEPFWVNFKLLGVIPLTFLFIVANMMVVMRHATDPNADKGASPAE